MCSSGLVFVLAFIISFCMTPLAKKIAFKVGAIAQPRKRDMHSKPIPRRGGIAIVAGSLITPFVTVRYIPILDWKQIIGFPIGAFIHRKAVLWGRWWTCYNLTVKWGCSNLCLRNLTWWDL